MKDVEFPKSDDWVPIEDDGCRWVLDLPGGPFVVLPCDVCKTPVEIFVHEVRCPICGKHTPEAISGELIDVLKLWNEMVDHDETESRRDPSSPVQ